MATEKRLKGNSYKCDSCIHTTACQRSCVIFNFPFLDYAIRSVSCGAYEPKLDAVTGTAEGGEPMKIDELEFSTRTYYCLKRVGIDTVEELLTMSDTDLMKIRGFGAKCLAEVHEKIRKPYGITIAPAIPGPSDADLNIMELCFHNGEQHMKAKVILLLDAFDKDYTLGDPFIEYDKLRKAMMDL